MEADQEFLKQVMRTLTNDPTTADLNFLIEAHAKLGYLSAKASGEADMAYAVRKHEEASAFARAINSGERVSAASAERLAELEVWELKKDEVTSRERSTKIDNLLRSVTEAINGIKFVGRLGG
jgi:hypothetical protein